MRFPAVLSDFIRAHLALVRVALPGRIVSYDPASQRASVQIDIQDGELDENEQRQAVTLPVVNDVPVMFPGAGTTRITFPIAAGDSVLLVFASSSIARWKASDPSAPIDPGDDQRHAAEDAIAIPGLAAAPATEAPTNALVAHADQIKLGGPDATELAAWHSALVALKNVFQDWVPVTGDGGDALKTALTTLISSGWPRGSSKVKLE